VGAEPTSSLRAAAARTPGVDVVGAVPDMEPYLWRTAVSVAPLRIARGVQNKVLEALAAGVPAVVTPAVMSGLPFEAHAGCPSAGTAAEFASAVLAVLAMTPEARRGLAARARLDTVTWEKRTASLKLTLLKAIPATGKR
jgi:glycosyltransferase involved in cell wall biosynthesis